MRAPTELFSGAGVLGVMKSSGPGLSRARAPRRILALVLPALASEIVRRELAASSQAMSESHAPEPRTPERAAAGHGHGHKAGAGGPPWAIVLCAEPPAGEVARASVLDFEAANGPAEARLAAVGASAARLGLFAGQALRDAAAAAPNLRIHWLASARLASALSGLSDVVRCYGARAALEEPDTIWLDVSHCAQRFGGEPALALEVGERVAALGHDFRVAIADGPTLAQAFARFASIGPSGVLVVPSSRTVEALNALPALALPITRAQNAELARAGVLTVADLVEQAAAAAPATIGQRGSAGEAGPARLFSTPAIEALLRGQDERPLEEHERAPVIREELLWHVPVQATALLSLSREQCQRLAARLEGRGEAASELEAVAYLRSGAGPCGAGYAEQRVRVRLPRASARAADFEHALHKKLRRVTLSAPALGFGLEVRATAASESLQGSLAFAAGAGEPSSQASAIEQLAAELSVGASATEVGLLASTANDEGRVPLLAVGGPSRSGVESPPQRPRPCAATEPSRLLPSPVPVGSGLERGQLLFLGQDAYVISAGRREKAAPGSARKLPHREYVRLWLHALSPAGAWGGVQSELGGPPRACMRPQSGAQRGVEVLAFYDPHKRRAYVAGFYD